MTYRPLWGNCRGCGRITAGYVKDWKLLCPDCMQDKELVKEMDAAWERFK
jgi:hypothetical protein